MIRKRKSKILVFLLMLGILYGCKRQILDPLNPQTNLLQKAQFDKFKGFYEKGRYKNQPKTTSGNERMTAADSARFKDFEPEWDKTEVELLPNNEKMLIVPVVRFLSVEYNQEIGFIRRLCIRVDENDDLLEANIVELIGNLTFVKANHNDIFKNYKNTSIIGFSGYVIIYEIDYDVMLTNEYESGAKVTDSKPCTGPTITNTGGTTYNVTFCNGSVIHGGTFEIEPMPDIGLGVETTCGGGTDPNNVPPPPLPCKGSNCPPKDEGVSWELEEDMSEPISLEDSLKLVKFNKIFISNDKTRDKNLKFAKELDSMRNISPIVDSLYRKTEAIMRTRALTLGFTPKIHIRHLTAINGANWGQNFGECLLDARGTPTMRLGEKAGINVFIEEFTHALQFFERNSTVMPNNTELIHLEMEAKIINHLIFGVDNGTALFRHSKSGLLNYEDSYLQWITAIKLENLSNFGTGQFCWTNFERYIEYFATLPHAGYNHLQNLNFVATRQPTILFLLFR